MIISTRKSQAVRERLLPLGISQISGGSRTSVGGYDHPESPDDNSAQFDVSDQRSLDEVVRWLMEMDYIPVSAPPVIVPDAPATGSCPYVRAVRSRTAATPMPSSPWQEFLEDYASPETQSAGQRGSDSARLLLAIPNEKVRTKTEQYLTEILHGARDFRF